MNQIAPESERVRGESAATRRRQKAFAMEMAALELFAARGYDLVTLDDIASVVGVHERTVLRYFGSKEELLYAMPRRAGDEMREELVRRPSSESPVEALCRALEVVAHRNPRDAPLRLLWARAAVTYPTVFAAVVADQLRASTDVLAKRAETTMDRASARALASAIAGALHGLWQDWVDEGGLDDGVDSICAGLRLLEPYTESGHGAMRREIERLNAEVESLRVDRDLFREAAARLLEERSAS